MNSDGQAYFDIQLSMGNVLLKSAITDFAIQWAGFAVAAPLKTEKFFDLTGALTYVLLAYKSLQWGGKYYLRQKVHTGMVMVWALRLGSYLFHRVLKDGEDRRFSKVKVNPSLFFTYWTVQGLWVFLTILPTLLVNAKQNDKALTSRDFLGWGIWLAGFVLEIVADYQKSTFRANPDNAGKFINTGLWSISRHPNYFGEIMLWFGVYLASTSVFSGLEHISILSPMFVAYLLTRVSGIPILERSGLKRWGADPMYQEYIKSTAVLVPYLY